MRNIKAQTEALDRIAATVNDWEQACYNLRKSIENESAEFLALCKDDWSWEIPDSDTNMNPRREMIHECIRTFEIATQRVRAFQHV